MSQKPNYKNWIPPKLLGTLFGACLLCAFLFLLLPLLPKGTLRTALTATLSVAGSVLVAVTLWVSALYRAFSYNGKRQIARRIVEGVAGFVRLPEGGTGLDVGCGSGALTIACAKLNPKAAMLGVDPWEKSYALFSQELCRRNAEAEGVKNVEFQPGNALKLDFPDETFDAVTSNYVYHNIHFSNRQALLLETLRTLKKGGNFAIHDIMSPGPYGKIDQFADTLRGMGYQEVKLIRTSHGMFMNRWESLLLGLYGSMLLTGKK